MGDELLSIEETAELTGLSIATHRWYRANGTGPKSWKCGRRVKFWVRRVGLDGRSGGRIRSGWCPVTGLQHVPAPSEATWVSEWDFFKGSCGHQYWIRMFGVRGWTVETNFADPIEVELAGSQRSDGPIFMGIWIHGDTNGLNTAEALMLSATLSWAAEELERIQGDSR